MPDERQPAAGARAAAWPARGRGGESRWYITVKRAADVLLAAAGLLVLALPMLAVAAIIRMESEGSPIFRHRRVGQHGREIWLYKFRSMREDRRPIEEILTPEQLRQYRTEFKIEGDPRVTNVGKVIRRTSIDELPQLINILKGDISIIGPRPITEEELRNYGAARDALLSVKPGLTGYWQAYGRSDVGYGDGRRQEMELFYARNRSPAFDARIFFKTIVAVIAGRGAR
jgi:lipopolysaccharide/colanic/teichoic acid biosynthesis glycosyltransferase